MNIPFIDLESQYRKISNNINEAIREVIASKAFIMGPQVAEAEAALALFADVKHCISCASGTDALLMALMAKNIGPGDAVFTTPFTFVSTAEVIALLGATPVFVDIDPHTYNMDPEKLQEKIEETGRAGRLSLKAVIPVDLFGQPAEFDAINALAQAHNLCVIEDAAQSFGAEYRGRRTCGLSEIGATSFFPAKPLGCYGDGGAIFTNDDSVADILRSIRVHGMGGDKYTNIRIGLNGRMDTLQAAILLQKLAIYEEEIRARQTVAGFYHEFLSGISGLVLPTVQEGNLSVWAQYSIQTENRDHLLSQLRETGIPTAIYYPIPLHLQEAFRHLGHTQGDFPVSEAVSERIFSVPFHPYLEEQTIRTIADAIASCL